MARPRATSCAAGIILALGLTVAGCGKLAVSYTCEPACPAGSSCEASGCVRASSPDLGGRTTVDLTAPPCPVECAAPTPYCNAGHLCVECLIDSQCPAGTRCRPAGSITACLPGCTDDQGCAGLGASMKCCDGQCADTGSDAAHCGACGSACTAPHAEAVCSGGGCHAGACAAGWGDCNADPADGCEANLGVDASNCGGCAQACRLDHATAACATACYVGACDFGWADCDGDPASGCETPVLTDTHNCGACGAGCATPPHAVAACATATCRLASCTTGFLDCDGGFDNGCEVASASDPGNCGQCGNACSIDEVCVYGACVCKSCVLANARTTCTNLKCAFVACVDGFADCNHDLKDGCEVDLTRDSGNCGACGNACDPKVAQCGGGQCLACGNDCWGPQGCLTAGGHCIQFTCRPGNGGPMFCNGCKGWSEVTYDQWMHQGYCADVIATYRISNGTETKCGHNGPGCCGDSKSCDGTDESWHFYDAARGGTYVVGPPLSIMDDVTCDAWDSPVNDRHERLTACQRF